jgi:hypothetical protein
VASRKALVVVHERAGMATAIRALGSDERLQIASLIDLAIPPQRAAAERYIADVVSVVAPLEGWVTV